jgi:hypothetical protein
MADTKISGLPASTTPLAGTEVLPIVQSGVTRQVSVANLTAGRAISATELTLSTGNLIVSNGKGIDFSATPGTGTSELLSDYEEGTWTPTLLFGGGNNCTYSVQTGDYTKIGRQVTLTCTITLTARGGATGVATVSGFPFTSKASVPTIALWQGDNVTFTGTYPLVYQAGNATDCALFGSDNAGTYTILQHSNFANNSTLRFVLTYNV